MNCLPRSRFRHAGLALQRHLLKCAPGDTRRGVCAPDAGAIAARAKPGEHVAASHLPLLTGAIHGVVQSMNRMSPTLHRAPVRWTALQACSELALRELGRRSAPHVRGHETRRPIFAGDDAGEASTMANLAGAGFATIFPGCSLNTPTYGIRMVQQDPGNRRPITGQARPSALGRIDGCTCPALARALRQFG